MQTLLKKYDPIVRGYVEKLRKQKYTFWHGLMVGIVLLGVFMIWPSSDKVSAENSVAVQLTFSGNTESVQAAQATNNLHFARLEVVDGELNIVPYTTLFDVALIYPPEGEPFTVESVPDQMGKNWLHYGGEVWAYDNILGLQPGITYFRETIRRNNEIAGFRIVAENGEIAYEWTQQDE